MGGLRLRLNSTMNVEVDLRLSTLTVIVAKSGAKCNTVLSADTLCFMRGDANGDGHINIADAMFIAQYLAGLRDENLDLKEKI